VCRVHAGVIHAMCRFPRSSPSLHRLFDVTRIRHVTGNTEHFPRLWRWWQQSGRERDRAVKECDLRSGAASAIGVAAPMPVPAPVTKAYGRKTRCWKSFGVPDK